MSYNLFLDDLRNPKDVTWVKENEVPEDIHYWDKSTWVVVRNYKDFVQTIEKRGLPKFISFDHDLADEHYPWNNHLGIPKYGKYKELTGYECAKWLCDYCLDKNLPLPKFVVHSMNIMGKENIEKYLINFSKQGSVAQPEGGTLLKPRTVTSSNLSTTTNLLNEQ